MIDRPDRGASGRRVGRSVVPGGVRGRLTAAIGLITLVVVAGSYVGLREGTRAELERKVDDELEVQLAEFQQFPRLQGVRTTAELERGARAFIDSQRYHPASTVFLIEPAGGRAVTNQSELVEELELGESEERGQSGLLDAPIGLSDVTVEDAGELRVLSQPIVSGGKRLGTFRVAEPLRAVEQAEQGLRDTFLIVGAVALAVALAAAAWAASVITRPLRRMARVASAVDAGELAHRFDVETRDEVGLLADSFNGMLDRLEGAFEQQRAFVSDASHELRTPITILRGQVEQLRSETDPDKRREIVDVLLREIDRMTRLVEDLLLLARAESGSFLERRSVKLSDFFEDLRRDLPLFGERDYVVGEPPPGILDADPDRLSQVLRNLVQNAVRHTQPGDRVAVSAEPRDGSIEFSVSDDGPGIPEDQAELIFSRFHRIDAGRTRDGGGSGLGLAIARAIVEAHGGRIWAQSQPGSGATIRFQLPGYRP